MCQIGTKSMIPGTVEDKVEQNLMKELQRCYSKVSLSMLSATLLHHR